MSFISMNLKRGLACRPIPVFIQTLGCIAAVWMLTGCGTSNLNAARKHFYQGHLEKAEQELETIDSRDKDRVLAYMERGTIRQAAGKYENSTKDYLNAYEELKKLEAFSVSRGTASMVINDGVQDFLGTPFERILLHAFTELNHLARGDIESAAIEARRIVYASTEEQLNGFPDVAFARYLAGLAFDLIEDPSNAALQYRKAGELNPLINIQEKSGWISAETVDTTSSVDKELIVIALLGRSPTGHDLVEGTAYSPRPPYIEIWANDQRLGRSFLLSDVDKLTYDTLRKQALAETVKTVSRIALKEVISQSVEEHSGEAWGALVRMILIGLLEQPDIRRWETLPRWLQIARVHYPNPSESITIKEISPYNRHVKSHQQRRPIRLRDRHYFVFYRDIQTFKPRNNEPLTESK